MGMKNVILLAMSTLPFNGIISVSNFKTPEGNVIEDCQSQLEPVVRYYLTQCYGGETDIIILETPDTTIEQSVTIPNGRSGIVNSSTQNASRFVSAVEFFKERISLSVEKQKSGSNLYYKEITLDLQHSEKAIKEAIDYIRMGKKVSGDEFRLFIDTHGGLRDVAQIMTAIVSLLQEEAIIPTMICGTVVGKNLIVDQKKSFNIFTFVSGMNDFIHFGNADVLSDYYERQSTQSPVVQCIIGTMKKIALGTQICDPDTYTDGLKELAVEIKTSSLDDELFSIFIDNIKDDYGDLLKDLLDSPETNENRLPDPSPLAIVERCIRKKMYQQGLTFIESMMPTYFFDKRILYYDDEENNQQIIDDTKLNLNLKYESRKNFVFNSFVGSLHYYRNNNHGDSGNQSLESVRRYSREYIDHEDEAENYQAPPVYDDTDNHELKFDFMDRDNDSHRILNHRNIDLDYRNHSGRIQVKTDLPYHSDNYRQAGEVMRMHKVLKWCRNAMNHASDGTRPEIDDVINTMKLYVVKVHHLENCMR